MFTDGTTFIRLDHRDIQEITIRYLKSAKVFEFKFHLQKIEITCQISPGSHERGQDIQIENQLLTHINKFKYPCSTVENNNRLDAELDAQASNTLKAIGGRRKRVRFNKDLSIDLVRYKDLVDIHNG